MNRIGLFAILGALIATSAYAAQSYDPAVPQGLSGQRVEPAGELATPAPGTVPPRLVQNQRRSRSDADARQCLDQANNKSVHRCSLRYRSQASREASSVKRASAKGTAAPVPAPAPSAEVTRPPADVGKPGAPRPGDAAKAADIVKPIDVTKPAGSPKAVESAKAPEPAKPAAPPTPPPTAPAKAAEPAKK